VEGHLCDFVSMISKVFFIDASRNQLCVREHIQVVHDRDPHRRHTFSIHPSHSNASLPEPERASGQPQDARYRHRSSSLSHSEATQTQTYLSPAEHGLDDGLSTCWAMCRRPECDSVEVNQAVPDPNGTQWLEAGTRTVI
jgi:hypothetical protein